jgi:hypothetical protein
MYGMAGFTTWHNEHVREYLPPLEEEVVAPLLLSSSLTTFMNERIRLRIKPILDTPVPSTAMLFIVVLFIHEEPHNLGDWGGRDQPNPRKWHAQNKTVLTMTFFREIALTLNASLYEDYYAPLLPHQLTFHLSSNSFPPLALHLFYDS